MPEKDVENRKIPLIGRIYALACLVAGVLVLALGAFLAFSLATSGERILSGSHNVTLTLILSVIQVVLLFVAAAGFATFGVLMLRNRRRHVAQLAYGLIALEVVEMVVEIMLHGFGDNLVSGFVQLVILVVIASTIDPTLIAERRLQRKLRDMETEEAAEAGTLGRAKGDRGFIELDFFNLFWVFVVCCVLGLVIETVYHMVVVDPGVYQDRAGMLFGPFSPIYGCGAVLMTIALNRFYKANPVVIFLVAAVIGGLFEATVSWFMQTAFGAVAWDYSGFTIFGLFPDPVAELFDGRTSTLFMCMWGALGFVWIKLCLPWLLRLINLIPWKARYAVTTVCAALMLVNGVMTLQSLECWYERESGIQPSSPVEEFYAQNFDDAYMAHRFQSMTITPEDTARAARA
ncbi:putative ABC transporter permease [Olsenella profusa]|uniref:ABC transporter permease n=1 Tax=Olsenella profusa TaxID=138595 RepID=A0ABS2F0A4_9ACTN|nr:putative ABC transporter permease [Olsenella profusa]MBM6774242.1 putative ABC transporter permease [Olsenella profusa]